LSNRMSSKSSQPRLARHKTRSDTTLSPSVRKLDSSRTLPPTVVRKKSMRSSLSTTRQSSDSLHLGRAACTVPEHDDLHKRNERLKEALKKEKEQSKIIRDEYEERESSIVRENAKLKDEIAQLHDERVKNAQRHEQELALIAEKHRSLQAQIERNHQNELKQIFVKNDELVTEKNRAIETLKAQIAQLMQGQSKERQAQLAELRKKLVNAATEANDLRSEIMKLNANREEPRSSDSRELPPQIRVALCMNCIVMQQALTMANTALKAKMKELANINRNANKIKIGLALNDLALDSLEKSQK